MKVQKTPVHINAKKDEIAEVVLMPGDPLRAKYIADNFLKDVKEVTNVRNMLGFTGTYKGHRVTVMGSGMGMPSMGIYAFELFYFYNVQKIVRIGTCGAVNREVKVPEIIIADRIFSDSRFAFQFNGSDKNIVNCSTSLVNKLCEKAVEREMKFHKGSMMTIDVFGPYVDDEALLARAPKWLNILGEEMEGFALVHVADSFNREAAVIATVVDSIYDERLLSVQERQTSLDNMITLGLDSLI